MGVEQSTPHRPQASPDDFDFSEFDVPDAVRETTEESSVPSEQIEHAWDPEDRSPRFIVLSDRLTARRLPSPLTTDAIRGTQILWKTKWSTMTRTWDKENKSESPTGIERMPSRTLGRALSPLSYQNSRKASPFNWLLVWHASYILLESTMSMSSWIVINESDGEFSAR